MPLVAVAAANCINIPLMRRSELQNGIALVDDRQTPLAVQSKTAATEGIAAVVLSRITMAMPGMGKQTAVGSPYARALQPFHSVPQSSRR